MQTSIVSIPGECPVCLAYIENTKLLAHLDPYLHEALINTVEGMRQRALHAGSDPTLQRLRALFCVEVIRYKLLPAAVLTTGCNINTRASQSSIKSRADLDTILSLCEDLQGDLFGTELEMSIELKKATGGDSAGLITRGHTMQARRLLDICMESVELLKSQLRIFQSLTRVGWLLAEAYEAVNALPDKRVMIISDLIHITETNVKRGWEV